MSKLEKDGVSEGVATRNEQPESSSRRSMLKGSTSMLPVIFTLQSGAAMAQSSNLIGAAEPYTTDPSGNTLCLNTSSVYEVSGSDSQYDMGEPAYARVDIIRERDYRTEASRRSPRIDESEMCLEGRAGYYRRFRSGRWQKVETRGIIVSATALHSFSGQINFTDL